MIRRHRPNPYDEAIADPSYLTTAQMIRMIQAERDWTMAQLAIRDQRLDGIDRATEVLNETVTRTPTIVQTEIGHVRELLEEKFQSVERQFSERDVRFEAGNAANQKAVDAAFAAQKELGAAQNASNTMAIDKSDAATDKAIGALDGKLDDIRERVLIIENVKRGGTEQQQSARSSQAGLYAAVGAAVGLIGLLFALMTLVNGQ